MMRMRRGGVAGDLTPMSSRRRPRPIIPVACCCRRCRTAALDRRAAAYGSRLKAGMTGVCDFDLAAQFARVLLFSFTLPNQRAQGTPDARCTRGLVCKHAQKNAHEHTGSAEAIRHSLRNGFTAYNALSPVIGFLAT